MSLSQGRGKRGDPSAGEKTKARSTSGSLLKIPSVCVVEGTAGIARPAEEVAGAENGRLEAREEVAIALLTRRWRCGKKRKHIAPPIDFLHIEKGQVKRLSEVRSRVEGKSSSASRATSRRAEGKREFPFYRKQAGPRDRREKPSPEGGTGREELEDQVTPQVGQNRRERGGSYQRRWSARRTPFEGGDPTFHTNRSAGATRESFSTESSEDKRGGMLQPSSCSSNYFTLEVSCVAEV